MESKLENVENFESWCKAKLEEGLRGWSPNWRKWKIWKVGAKQNLKKVFADGVIIGERGKFGKFGAGKN